MSENYTLINETPTAAVTVKGWEKMIFVSGDFDGGRLVVDFSPDEATWFSDKNLTFSFKGFETFLASPSVRYRFRMENTANGSPNVLVQIA